jgi:thymidylate synthase (FAD)
LFEKAQNASPKAAIRLFSPLITALYAAKNATNPMQVKHISTTKPEIEIDGQLLTPEGLIAYCARVSSPNQQNPIYAQLLRYCIREKHWSIFEMVDMTIEIITTRAIAAQILRHRSFCFSEFSQRYAEAMDFEPCEARRQDAKNRQNSIDDLPEHIKTWFLNEQEEHWCVAFDRYEQALDLGIAKECARMVLPLNTVTQMYMKGSVRSWIHYFDVRCHPSTQKEHRDIAMAAKEIFVAQFPTVSQALDY